MKQNIMRNFLPTALFLFVAALLASAQTQNRVAAQTMPSVDYSESISYEPRKFPVVEKSKSKKDKKSKRDEQTANKTPDVAVLPLKETETTTIPLPLKKNETITIPVSVFDANGNFLLNLKQADFKIFADGEEQEILSVSKRDEPINIILMIDTSPSTANTIEKIQNYSLAIVERLKPEDKVAVIEFNRIAKVLTELTSDRQIITEAIRKTNYSIGTSLYEAASNTFSNYISQIQGRTTVVLMTDGVDTTSRKTTYADSLIMAEKMNASVFPVYIDTSQDAMTAEADKANRTYVPGIFGDNSALRSVPRQSQGATAADYEIGKMYLVDLSVLSGGRLRVVKDITNTRAKNVDNIGEEMRAQYQITFRPTNFVAAQRKQIRVRVNRPSLRLQARGSLIVGGNNEKAAGK